MSTCDCCCEIVANCRGHRLPARIGDSGVDVVPFVDWINRSHKFHEYEPYFEVTYLYNTGDADSYGPETLESDGKWSEGIYVGYARVVGGGSITIASVWGTKHTIRIASYAGGEGDTFTFVAFGQTAKFQNEEKTRTLGEINPGLTWFKWNVYAATKDQIDDAKDVPIKYGTMVYGDTSLCIWNESFGGVGGLEIAAWRQIDGDEDPWVVTASSFGRAKNDLGVEDLPFPREEINRSPFFPPYPQDPSSQPPDYVIYGIYGKYFNKPVYVRGEKVTLYRNGEVVLQGIRPSDEATLAATDKDGSYLIVSEVDESTNRPWTEAGIDTRRRWPRPWKQLASFVVDRDGAVIGATPPQDFWVDQREIATGGEVVFTYSSGRVELRPGHIAIASTKPIQRGKYAIGLDSDGPPFVRPYVYNANPFTYGIQDNGIAWVTQPDKTDLLNLPVGVHSVVPLAEYINSSFKDLAGNDPAYIPTFTVQIHAVPQDGRRGARPRLEDVGLQTREYWRPRQQNEQVREVRLTWDRKVRANTVTADQLTLTRNGETVEGCSIEQKSDTEWLVKLPDEPQGSKEYWLLTYDPAGDVVTDDTDGAPEPCVLATRVGWLMASFDGWLEPEDTSFRRVLIGTVPSILKQIDAPPEDEEPPEGYVPFVDDGKVTIATTGGCGILDWGSHAKGIGPDAFTPMVPPPPPDEDDEEAEPPPYDCSYWGMKTTIDPCPPREVTACACPRAAQRHSSAIVSSEDIQTFTLSLVWRSTDGTEGGGPPGGWPREDFAEFGEVNLESSFNGSALPQNVWAAEVDERSPVETTDTLGTYTRTVQGGAVFVEAFRFVTEHTGLKTAYLNELEFDVRFRGIVKTEIEPTEEGEQTFGKSPEDRYNTTTAHDRFAISKDQEESFANGDAVYARFKFSQVGFFKYQGGAYWWKLQKTQSPQA